MHSDLIYNTRNIGYRFLIPEKGFFATKCILILRNVCFRIILTDLLVCYRHIILSFKTLSKIQGVGFIELYYLISSDSLYM